MVVIEKEKETGSRDYRVKQIEHGNIYISHDYWKNHNFDYTDFWAK